MSQVTTGAVILAFLSPIAAAGVACIGALHFAGKYCVKQYENMLEHIEKNNIRLKWLDKQVCSSPVQMAEEALHLQKMVSTDSHFLKMATGLNDNQKQVLAGAIATQHSPLRTYVSSILENTHTEDGAFEKALKKGTRNLALDNFKFVNKIVNDAAKATGFASGVKVLRKTESLMDIAFADDKNRRLSAYCKLDKQMNPSLALDLEGFGNDTNECALKMNEIVKYLQEHGVPFSYKTFRHNQPQGVLRNLINHRKGQVEQTTISNYLTDQSTSTNVKLKTK